MILFYPKTIVVIFRMSDLYITQLPYNMAAKNLASKHGLDIQTVVWEDTGRTKGSCWGPNISDMTLTVNNTNMPIIRKPNFTDLTSEQPITAFHVNVGNETSSTSTLTSIPLQDYIKNIGKYTDVKLKEGANLFLERDANILTSAQACVLPLKDGKVEFAVKLFNYQSSFEPAVLVIVSSAQGTSSHFVMGRENILEFNKGGLKAKFLAERLKDDRKRRGVALEGPMTEDEKIRNALMIFQIPLKVTKIIREGLFLNDTSMLADSYDDDNDGDFGVIELSCIAQSQKIYKNSIYKPTLSQQLNSLFGINHISDGRMNESYTPAVAAAAAACPPKRGMDHGILSTTAGTTPFNSLAGHSIERDERMPIRCTIQYYHVTDALEISEQDMATIAAEVVRHNPISSLVTDNTLRPTEHTVAKQEQPTKYTDIPKKMLYSGL